MAAAILRHLAGRRAYVESAGVRAGGPDAFAAAAMEEIGIDLSHHAPRTLRDLHDTSTRLMLDAAASRVPTLVLSAGSEWVVDPTAQTQFYVALGSCVKRLDHLPGFYHDIYHERDRATPLKSAHG